jgi:predicted Zn-dependent protease
LALEKCLASRNPVTVEPGRYTTILEPQATSDLLRFLSGSFFHRNYTASGALFNRVPAKGSALGESKLGMRVVDDRLSLSADPLDPDLGFPVFKYTLVNQDPWSLLQAPIAHPTTWIKNGVLTSLEYRRKTGIFEHGENLGRPDLGALRVDVTGPTVSVDDMIATTKRGLVVTRFDQCMYVDQRTPIVRGYTRDGFWLVENGKITKAVVNMAFTESPLFVLNNIEQLGAPQRTFRPWIDWRENPEPAFVPAMKVRDFSFTALSSAV